MPLQIRRGTNAERLAMTQALAQGELLYVTDDQRLYIGNGATLGGVAITGYTNEDAQDAVAPMFTGGTHSGITFAYNDALNVINATLDLSTYSGTINAAAFKGTLTADDSTILIDAVDSKINLDGTVKGNIIPSTSQSYDIGSASYRFRNLYLSSSGMTLGAATISAVGSAINLPAGSTINGEPLGGLVAGSNFNINIIGDDSSIIVNSSTRTVTASGGFIGNLTGYHTGDVKGSVVADDSTMLVDSVSGLIVGDVENDTIITNDIVGASLVLNRDLVGGGIAIFSQSSLDDDVDIFNIVTAHSDTSASGMTFTRSRGTIASPTALNTNDNIFSFVIAGQSTTIVEQAVRIDARLDGSVGAGSVPGKLSISTADSSGALVERLTINSKGTSAFSGMIQLASFADETAADAAVGGTPLNGMMYYDTGAGKIKGRQGGAWVVLQP